MAVFGRRQLEIDRIEYALRRANELERDVVEAVEAEAGRALLHLEPSQDGPGSIDG